MTHPGLDGLHIGAAVLKPEDVAALVVEPLTRTAVATQVSSVITTASTSIRFPIVAQDPASKWTQEGAEIDVTDADLNEIDCVPSKLAGLTIVTSELAADSDPGALQVVGDGLVRDLSVRLDSAFLGNSVQYGPSGLESLSGVQHVDGGSAFTDLDPFAEALSKAEVVGSSISAFVAHPDQLLALSTLKTASGYNTPLLQPDATSPTRRSILGVPIYWSPACSASTVWAIPASKVFTVIREGASIVTDTSAYFSSDRVGIRVTLRVGFAFPHEAAIVAIDLGGS